MTKITHTTAPGLKIKLIVISLLFLVALGTVLFKFLEPFTWIQSFYFTVSTMTTVGFGDLVPSTDGTRLVVALYMIVSVSLYVSFITFLGSHILENRVKQLLEKLTDEKADTTGK